MISSFLHVLIAWSPRAKRHRILQLVALVVGLGVASPVWADVDFEASEPVTVRAFVNPATSTDGGEEDWVKVESDADAKSTAWSPRGVCSRLAKVGRKAALPAMLAACDPASAAVELPSDVAVVQVYNARTGAWERGTVGDLEVGDEVLHDGHLHRVTSDGVEDRGFAEVARLAEADATWAVDGVADVPDSDDWVLVLGEHVDAGHWRLRDLTRRERFAIGGHVFEADEVDGELAVRATGAVLGRVYETHVRRSDVVIDLVVSGAEGDETITGTPEHPFWVDAVGDYVAMGELEVGTILRTVAGGEALVAAMEWREGNFEVFNFEVEGVHNYFVSAAGGGDDGVLVHNGCGPERLLDAARQVRDDAAAAVREAGQTRDVPAVTAAYSPSTGQVQVGVKRNSQVHGQNCCAEDIAMDWMPGDARLTEATRPRERAELPICEKCEAKYGRHQFPEGTRFKSDE